MVAPPSAVAVGWWDWAFGHNAFGLNNYSGTWLANLLFSAERVGEGYALACEALKMADLRPLAPNITARTLVVCGDDDIPSFLEAARWLASSIPNAELAWIAGAKHASVLEKPEGARRLIRNFLAA